MEEAAEWLWQSINPGVTYLFVPSMTKALPIGTLISGATLSILPFTNSMSHSFTIPLGPHVQILALSISTALGVKSSLSRP